LADLLAMIVRFIAEVVVQSLLELVIHGIAWVSHATAKGVLSIGTFGHVQAEPIVRRSGQSKLFRIYRQDETVMTGLGHAVLLGMIFWIIIGYIVLGVARSS
jgi:hypothetical protein